MRVQKNSPVPEHIQIVQKYLIAGFIEYGAIEYKGILSAKMFGIYGPLFDYFTENTIRKPEFYEICRQIGNEYVVELADFDTPLQFELPKYARELFEYYVTIHGTESIKSLEKIKKIFDRLEFLRTGNRKNSVHDLFLKVEGQIEIAKERGSEPLGYRTGIETIDKHCEGLQPGTVMTINAYSNTGKSKLSYFICNNLLRQGKKILYMSLEVTADKVLLNLLANWYKKDYNTIAKGVEMIDFASYYDVCAKQLEIIDNLYELSEMKRYTEISKPDVLIIDFVQNISLKGSNSEYERMTTIAMELQQLAIKNNIAILDLSQISNEGTQYKLGGMIPSKGSGALVASSDVGLMLYKRDDLLKLALAKNKFGQKDIETTLKVDFSKGIFEDLGQNEF